MKQNRLLPWFGADTEVGEHYVKALQNRLHVTIPFVGGAGILALLARGKSRQIVANDRHSQAINLYMVLRDSVLREQFLAALEFAPHHEALLDDAQHRVVGDVLRDHDALSVDQAVSYFISAWQARSGQSGTQKENEQNFSVRFTPTGGCSAKRWVSALESVRAEWGAICERTMFVCRDAFELLPAVADRDDCAVYCDPPWFGAGKAYRHKFAAEDHVRLRDELGRFTKTLVVIRYGDCPEVRALYPESAWSLTSIESRNQGRKPVAELLITNRGESR